MIRSMKLLTLPLILLVVLLVAACSSSDKETRSARDESAASGGFAGPPGVPGFPGNPAATAQPAAPTAPAAAFAPRSPSLESAAFATPAPFPTPAPAASAPSSRGLGLPTLGGDDTAFNPGGSSSTTEEEVALVAQQRIIVRTVDMQIVVTDVAGALDDIADLAQELGGWVVSSDRSQKHQGFISVRIPADKLDDGVLRLRQLAFEVDSEVTSSRDVTDEYVDISARLKNFQATEVALLRLMDRADKVEDALKVQTELTKIQGEVERLQGRISFLEQTAAFSLVNVQLKLAPIDMPVDAGDDQSVSVGQIARFRATFEPPVDIEDFTYTWDFGDGSPPVSGRGTAPTLDDDTRVTATITHIYADDRDSPFIAEIKLTGTGDAGLTEGEDTIIVTVTKVPTIQVFAGQNQVVEEGEELELVGSFTRPEGLSELSFRWTFGDGTAPVTDSLEEGVTNAVASHVYADNRPFPFTATLTITAQSDAGEVEASGSINVLVREAQGWVLSDWSAGDHWKTATRALSGVGQVAGTALIWLAIFSPVWLIVGGIALVIVRRGGARYSRRSRSEIQNSTTE